MFSFVYCHYFLLLRPVPIRYLPPLALYVLTSQPLAYADGYTLNFLRASAFTLAYRDGFVGTGLFLAAFLLLFLLTAIESPQCIVGIAAHYTPEMFIYLSLCQHLRQTSQLICRLSSSNHHQSELE